MYLLPTGPISSFLVVSDPEVTKFVLRSTDNPKGNIYNKVRTSHHWTDFKVKIELMLDGQGGTAWR